MPRALPLLLLVAAAVLTAAAPVAAHTPPRPAVVVTPPTMSEVIAAAAPEPAAPWAAVALVLTVALVGAWRPRRAVALGLVLVVGVLAFETGLHSTHHLGQPDESSRCVVAGLSSQLSGDLVDVTLDAPPAPVSFAPAVCSPAPVVRARLLAPDAGRAPPALSA